MKFLIPPSEGKSLNNTSIYHFLDTDFPMLDSVKKILVLLKSKKTDLEIQSIYGTNINKSLDLHIQNLNILNSCCSLAIERYTGVVFKNINWDEFNDKDKVFFGEHFLIFSGLFGMVSPTSLIPNYKLKMNVLSLHKFWNPIITEKLKDEDVIIDMLPQIHRKAYRQDARVMNIDFFHIKDGKKVNAGHFGKAVKGQFIRFITKNKIKKIDDFSRFNYNGFVWDGNCIIKE